MPGITAAIGGLAYAGIPATHRDVNSAVTFIAGHASNGELPDGLDWTAPARGAPLNLAPGASFSLRGATERHYGSDDIA
ncbi:MAG TPA: hypothetical protein VLV85_04075 [Stellaceae bacterium]|nr:hypothetical protein [Stellaceae bacterium]